VERNDRWCGGGGFKGGGRRAVASDYARDILAKLSLLPVHAHGVSWLAKRWFVGADFFLSQSGFF
jgi:hypothetical protein